MSLAAAAAQFRARLQNSEVLTPDSPGYADSLKRWNAAIETPSPIVIRPHSPNDIPTILSLTSSLSLDLAIHAGGHFAAPATSTTTTGVVLSLVHLAAVSVDAASRTATVQGGATAGDVSRAAAEHGLAAVVPNVSKVGFVGATVCGGLGHLSGRFGMMVDQLVSARVVVGDGREGVVRVSEEENGDLFWAMKGAAGVVGMVVVDVTVRLHRVGDEEGRVFAGAVMFRLQQVGEVVEAVNEMVPDREGKRSLMLVLAAPPPTATPMLIASVFFDGTEKDARSFFKRLYEVGPLMDHASMMSVVKAGSLVDWTAVMGKRQVLGSGAFETPLKKSLLDEVVTRFVDFVKRSPEDMTAEVLLHFTGLDKISAIKESESAFPCRGKRTQQVMIVVTHLHEQDDDLAKEFVDDVEAYLRGQLQGEAKQELSVYTGYDNNRTKAETVFGPGRSKRLQEIKAKCDPGNMFNKWYPLE